MDKFTNIANSVLKSVIKEAPIQDDDFDIGPEHLSSGNTDEGAEIVQRITDALSRMPHDQLMDTYFVYNWLRSFNIDKLSYGEKMIIRDKLRDSFVDPDIIMPAEDNECTTNSEEDEQYSLMGRRSNQPEDPIDTAKKVLRTPATPGTPEAVEQEKVRKNYKIIISKLTQRLNQTASKMGQQPAGSSTNSLA